MFGGLTDPNATQQSNNIPLSMTIGSLRRRFFVIYCLALHCIPTRSYSKKRRTAFSRQIASPAWLHGAPATTITKKQHEPKQQRRFVLIPCGSVDFILKSISRGGSSGATVMAAGSNNGTSSHLQGDDHSESPQHKATKLILIIDVDNTVYDEMLLRRTAGQGIEEQIIQNSKKFFEDCMNLTSDRGQELYLQYGSAVEGLRQEYWHNCSDEEMEQWMQRYYRYVYDGIDVSCLYRSRQTTSLLGRQDDKTCTGYSHENSQPTILLRDFLESLSTFRDVELYLASNSPKLHVDKIIRALGWNQISWSGILTPDTTTEADNTDDNNLTFSTHPTKHSPRQFFHTIVQQGSSSRIVLMDDSLYNIQRAKEELGIDGIHIQHGDDGSGINNHGLLPALHKALSLLYKDNLQRGDDYQFDDTKYLIAKNAVDRISINRNVLRRLADELAKRLSFKRDDKRGNVQLCVVDLGAGRLNMLEMFLSVDDENENEQSFLSMLRGSVKQPLPDVVYYAYESNHELLDECRLTLARLGFEAVGNDSGGDQHSQVFRRRSKYDGYVTVYLKSGDYRHEQRGYEMTEPHLIIGCCFADLLPPHELVTSIVTFLSKIPVQPSHGGSATLLYFPITFSGSTQFVPPSSFEFANQETKAHRIPSDTTAFSCYAGALEELGHNLEPSLLIREMERHGVQMVECGLSHWHIDPTCHQYLWQCMMHFLARIGAPRMLRHSWDPFGWLRRAFSKQPTIVVSNVDLLFRLPKSASISQSEEAIYSNITKRNESTLIQEIQFIAPHRVTTITKETETTLLPNQIRVQSVCSLISSGTELKIFQGTFSDDVLDVNIKGMSDQRMSYPLAYGYSMVGRVVECGSNVSNLLGRLVFCFSPHASGMILDVDSIHLVPDGVAAEDAIFMPSVETALSIVHDAHIRMGENVAVYGQGLIGLLVTSILAFQNLERDNRPGNFGTITTFDTILDRLAASGMMGASQALLPSDALNVGPFDVSIEVSGNPRALQAAIDHTSDGGRVIVASWYGTANVALKLGMNFHRSHKTIKTSQVSELPAELTGLWSKQRRFALTWELVKQIRPSRIVSKWTTLDDAQGAYEALCNGTEIAVAFDYRIR